ncbi:MAG TPA: hypothetical protein VLA46_05995 [Saprospiraceae bacterium]|nr:hypothetical protein [Saprospiraceae bacterium]
MKESKDALKKDIISVSASGIPKKKRPPGGKALARLKQFVRKRNLPLNLTKKMIPKKPDTRLMMRDTISSNVNDVPGGSTGFKARRYSDAVVETCNAVNTKTREILTAAPRTARIRPSANISAHTSSNTAASNAASTAAPLWRSIGPTSITNGQTYGNSRNIVSGRVAAIAIDPSDSKHILVGSAGGGVWESTDRGAHWKPRTDFMPSLKTGALAFDPSNPSLVYCGTGEGSDYAGLGQGLMKSTDGGTSWKMLCVDPFAGQNFFDLIVDPDNGKHLVAATTEGIYTSIDRGVNWTQRKIRVCWSLAMSSPPESNREVLAACYYGLYQSMDGCVSFVKMNLQTGGHKFERLAVAISKSNPGKAYAFGVLEGTKEALLWCRPAVDAPWMPVTTPADIDVEQAWYDWFLEVSPDDEDQIYLGAIEAYRGTKIGSTWKWVTISNKQGDDIHPDQHCITIDPANANNIFIGNDGGIFFSPNRGKDWQSLNVGLGITEIEYLSHNMKDKKWLLAGTQDNGTIRYTGKLQWEQVADGDGGDCGVNHAAPEVCYHTYYGMGMELSAQCGQKDTWASIGPDIDFEVGDIFYPPMEVNGDVVAQAGRSVFVSRTRGANLDEIPLPGGNMGTAMYIPTPDDLYVATHKGAIYKIKWKGTEWSKPKALVRPRPGAYISDLYVDAKNLNRIWVTSTTVDGNRCFRSDDGGASWVNCTPDLTDLPISSIEVDPLNANCVWIAADVGVYQSKDAGVTWSAYSNGLPNAIACDLIYNPKAKLLRVGLRNRGVWELKV